MSDDEFATPARPPRASRAMVFGSSAHERAMVDKQPGENPNKARVEARGVAAVVDDDAAATGRSPSLSGSHSCGATAHMCFKGCVGRGEGVGDIAQRGRRAVTPRGQR